MQTRTFSVPHAVFKARLDGNAQLALLLPEPTPCTRKVVFLRVRAPMAGQWSLRADLHPALERVGGNEGGEEGSN
jgi:hypothetical protein